VMVNRALAGGGYRHDEEDAGGPYLADTLEMGRGFLALYTATAERVWLERADAAGHFIDAQFRAPVGYATAAGGETKLAGGMAPRPETDENIELARFANMLGYYTGKSGYKTMAEHAMQYLAAPAVVKAEGYEVGGILLANEELSGEPSDIVIVGAKGDAAAGALYAAALRGAPGYARLEWYDRAEGPLPNADVEYPALAAAAAYVCTNQTCSAPVRTADALAQKLARLGTRE
jgi:uncharacterized protein